METTPYYLNFEFASKNRCTDADMKITTELMMCAYISKLVEYSIIRLFSRTQI
jgi:hypothetical protein